MVLCHTEFQGALKELRQVRNLSLTQCRWLLARVCLDTSNQVDDIRPFDSSGVQLALRWLQNIKVISRWLQNIKVMLRWLQNIKVFVCIFGGVGSKTSLQRVFPSECQSASCWFAASTFLSKAQTDSHFRKTTSACILLPKNSFVCSRWIFFIPLILTSSDLVHSTLHRIQWSIRISHRTMTLNQNGKRGLEPSPSSSMLNLAALASDSSAQSRKKVPTEDSGLDSEFFLVSPLEAGFAPRSTTRISSTNLSSSSVEYIGAPPSRRRMIQPSRSAVQQAESQPTTSPSENDLEDDELADLFVRSTWPSARLQPRRSNQQSYQDFLQERHDASSLSEMFSLAPSPALTLP